MQLLNIGCGNRFHTDWVNIDKVLTDKSVKQCDVEKGLPFSDCSFDVVYHSHVLEHFSVNDVPLFLKECYRVLIPGGVIRVAVPDLEQIVLCYLGKLKKACSGSKAAREDYEWIMLEMYDQVVRNSSGGAMAAYINRPVIPNKKFVVGRCGVEVQRIINSFASRRANKKQVHKDSRSGRFFLSPIRLGSLSESCREWLLKQILGREYKTLQIGRFRCSGENHQWMYDRLSLEQQLEKCGFTEIVQRDALKSFVPNWEIYNLDTEADGSVYKPDSLYMEALKAKK